MSDDNSVAAFLAEHPKMTGVLFTVLLMLTQVGGAAASTGSTCAGP